MNDINWTTSLFNINRTTSVTAFARFNCAFALHGLLRTYLYLHYYWRKYVSIWVLFCFHSHLYQYWSSCCNQENGSHLITCLLVFINERWPHKFKTMQLQIIESFKWLSAEAVLPKKKMSFAIYHPMSRAFRDVYALQAKEKEYENAFRSFPFSISLHQKRAIIGEPPRLQNRPCSLSSFT